MKTKIVVKVKAFPRVSETFITNHMVMLLNNGFIGRLLVKTKNDNSQTTQKELINSYKLLDKTNQIKHYDLSTWLKKIVFVIKALVLKPSMIKYLKTFNAKQYGTIGKSGNLFYKLFQIKAYLKFDVIHIQFGINSYPFIQLKKYGLLNQKIVVTFHGFDAHFTPSTLSQKKEEYKSLFELVDLITVNTAYLKEKIITLGGAVSKIKIMPMPVNTDKFVPANKTKTNSFKLISIGRLVEIKGHSYALKTVSELIRRGHAINLTIIGEGEERLNLETQIKHLGLENNVTICGEKSQDFIISQLQQSDVFLMTSITDSTGRQEAQGVVTIEAQSCQIPVVVFNSGGVPYTLKDTVSGFLCKEKDVIEMANKIEFLINNEQARISMGKAARQFVLKEYSNTVMAKQWKQLYNNLITN